jgi:DNA-binding NtrC family response regulator
VLAIPSGNAPARCVLVVDDELGMRETLTDVLTASGFDVHTAASGEAAIAALDEAPCRDVVLMDIRMAPGLDGVAAMRQMHALAPELPVVLMTAYTNEALAMEAERGAIAVLQKPLDFTLVLPLLQAIVGQ